MALSSGRNSIILGLLIVGVIAFTYFSRSAAGIKVRTPSGQTIKAELADSDEEKTRGLSGRTDLKPNEGMLFAYDTPQIYCYWMKDMKFAIDIVWLDENKEVVDIAQHVAPESYPQTYCPKAPAKFTLEISSGKASELGLSEGQELFW